MHATIIGMVVLFRLQVVTPISCVSHDVASLVLSPIPSIPLGSEPDVGTVDICSLLEPEVVGPVNVA